MTYNEVRKQLIQDAAKVLTPILGEFELTGSCNLKCQMCYVRDDTFPIGLSTSEWKDIFTEAVNKGMLFALLTGGEIFIRPDFEELYNFLYDLGVRITLFTNGTLISEKIVSTLRKRPPEYVAITLYGASDSTYHQITKVPNGFDMVNRGIDLLLKNKINIMLRTIPIKAIFNELDDIINYAKSKNLYLGYSLYIGPKREACSPELSIRLNPEELIIFENKFVKAFGFTSNTDFRNSKNGFTCAALRSAYFITWEGKMQACAMLSINSKSVLNNKLSQVWDELSIKVKEIDHCHDCKNCNLKGSCIQCMARLHLEGGFTKCSPYIKDIAKLRYEVRNGKI
jgi:MoaA/NifB/PqqE/SkfB family radical SAM enzyme